MDRSAAAYNIRKGNPDILGAIAREEGANFAFEVPDGTCAQLILTDKHKGEIIQSIPLLPDERTGDIASVFVEKFDCAKDGYYYTVKGEKVLDPYARAFDQGVCTVIRPDQKKPEALHHAVPLHKTMIYKLHVRGFTKGSSSDVRCKGTFAGVEQKLDYIAELGFTTVEFMPMYEWDATLNMLHMVGPDGKYTEPVNYWGYAEKNYYFAPKEAYASTSDSVGELTHLISAMHKKGLEAVMEFYVPYGTSPMTVYQAARYWQEFYTIDGFHFMGSGVPMDILERDPYLTHTKLFFEHIDAGRVYKNRLPIKRHLAEYNDGFMMDCRSFLKGDEGRTGSLATDLHRNSLTHGYVNYMANVNGFTLMDAVSYDWKHNEKNGEDNQDGPSVNMSWNCGVEGPSRKKAVRKLRMTQIKNAMAYIFLAQGVPLLMAGDEFGNSQSGNNNAYSSDNQTGWVDWRAAQRNTELTSYLKSLIAFRKNHPILHMRTPLRETDYLSLGYPDISFHDTKAWYCPFENASRSLGIMYCGLYAGKEGESDDFLYIAFNAYWEDHEFALPSLPKGSLWFTAIRTDSKAGEECVSDPDPLADQRALPVSPRSVTVLIGLPAGKV